MRVELDGVIFEVADRVKTKRGKKLTKLVLKAHKGEIDEVDLGFAIAVEIIDKIIDGDKVIEDKKEIVEYLEEMDYADFEELGEMIMPHFEKMMERIKKKGKTQNMPTK